MADNWLVRETEFTRTSLRPQESVFTIGNGYLSTRGAFEEGFLGEQPATMIHGVFDDVPIVMTELANAPNWLPLVPVVDGERVQLDAGEILSYERVLNLQNGELTRAFRWRSPGGRTVDVRFERFASLADKNILAVRCRVTPLDWSGAVEFQASLAGEVDNLGVQHWNKVAQGEAAAGAVFLESGTRKTGIHLCEAARLHVEGGAGAQLSVQQRENAPTVVGRVQVTQGQAVTAEKIVAIYTALDVGRNVRAAALGKLEDVAPDGPAYDRLREANDAAWARYWATSDVEIEGDDLAQVSTRYNLFQLLIAAPRDDPYVSIAAKTLSGFGYRGHVFWDTEIFILPFFTFTQPQIARNLLLYRYHTLGGARRKAQEGGYKGAQYAWESAATGDEVTPRLVPGPDGQEVRIWTGDIELHISSDIALAVWQYWQATGDDEFMVRYGAEMILDTAVFWGSRVEWNRALDRYQLTDVIGPDEYHEHVDNNFYTNYLVQWHLRLALQVAAWMEGHDPAKAAELTDRLQLAPAVFDGWRHVIDKLYIGHAPDGQVFEQFEGYFERRDVDLAALEPRGQSVQALFGIKGTNDTQVLKQPDVLMLFYMLPNEFDAAIMKANWDYYTPRTDLTHGSSLAPGIQAILACRMGDIAWAYRLYMQATLVDLQNLRLNTGDGIHGATAGSVWQAAAFGFGGLRVTEAGVVTRPQLPAGWKRLKFHLFYRGEQRDFAFEQEGPA